ncbi:MAG: hypothetical protein M3Q69_04720, partial [Acidobacteriota bacterium]|nr:hypothetical protein [Acidobacteriota bacterium]
MIERRRETALSFAFALWGLAIAIASIAFWSRPAPPEQLPGVAKMLGFDAHGPFRWIASLMLLPIFVPLAMRPVARRLARSAAWARNGVFAGALVVLWMVTARQSVVWTIVPFALLIATCTLLRERAMQFTRRDVVLLPTFFAALLGLIDVAPSLPIDGCVAIAALLVFALRIAVPFIASPVVPALAFMAAPLGLALQTSFFARDQRYFGWHALAIVVITPFVLRLTLRNRRRAWKILALAIYPLALYCYSNALSVTTAEGKPRANYFEDGHALLPASEYLRGELPYRDILPAHGLVEDGLFDYVIFRLTGRDNIGTRAKAREVAGTLVAPALYLLAMGMTGSAEAGFLTVLLSFMTGTFLGHIRLIAPVLTLAAIVFATRRRRPRLFAYAGFASVIAGFVSLDFAAYTFAALVVTVLRSPQRRQALRATAIGIAAAAIPSAIALAAFGILDDFVRGTFIETLSAGPAYVMNFFTAPTAMAKTGGFPDVFAALLDREVFPYLFWTLAAVFVGVMVTRPVSRRIEPMVTVGIWIVASAISYAERHHLYFTMFTNLAIVFAAVWLLRHRQRAAAMLLVVMAIILSAPNTHFAIIGWMRHTRGPIDPAWIEVRNVPRARGALFW